MSQRSQPRIYHAVDALGPTSYDCFTSNIDTAERSVKERVFYVKVDGKYSRPPNPVVDVDTRLERFEQKLDKALIKVHGTLARWSLDRVLQHYTGQKRKLYERARALYDRRGINEKDSEVEVFLKWEKIESTPGEKKTWEDRVCRIISPRKPVYRLILARYLLQIEEPLKKGVDKVLSLNRPHHLTPIPTILKGLDCVQTAKVIQQKFNRFRHPIIVMTDATRWDQHVSEDQLCWEHRQYLKFHRNPKHRGELNKLLEQQLYNKCKGYFNGGNIKYEVEGTRMSGDINTSMGNCLLMVANMWSVLEEMKIKDYELGNNGDDTFIIMELSTYMRRFDDTLFTRLWKEVGFNMVIEGTADTLEQLKFCQSTPVYDGESYRMVRTAVPVLTKDCISLKPLTTSKLRAAYLWNISAGGLALTGGMPVLDSFYSSFKRGALSFTSNIKSLTKYQDYFNHDRFNYNYSIPNNPYTSKEITTQARVSFALAFDVSPPQQRALEHQYANLVVDPEVISAQPSPAYPVV